jgi:hypothetical protein
MNRKAVETRRLLYVLFLKKILRLPIAFSAVGEFYGGEENIQLEEKR